MQRLYSVSTNRTDKLNYSLLPSFGLTDRISIWVSALMFSNL